MDLAIIIVSFNVRELLRGCLRSVYASLQLGPALDASVWVVDNASGDGSPAMVREQFPQVRLIASQENLGFAAGNNLALRLLGLEAAGREARRSARALEVMALSPFSGTPRYVLLLNSDTVVQGDALTRMVAFLDGHPPAGGCGARLAYPDGSFQHGAFRFPGLAQIGLDLFPPPGRLNRPLLDSRLNGRYSKGLYETGMPFAVDFVLGATLMVRSRAVDQVGLLDEGYFMYCEEMDWQRRLRGTGWPMYCVPQARVAHYGGASTGQVRGPMLVALWRSRLRYFRRYHGRLFNRLAGGLVRLGMLAEARRARAAGPADLDQRLAAYREIGRLAAGQVALE